MTRVNFSSAKSRESYSLALNECRFVRKCELFNNNKQTNTIFQQNNSKAKQFYIKFHHLNRINSCVLLFKSGLCLTNSCMWGRENKPYNFKFNHSENHISIVKPHIDPVLLIRISSKSNLIVPLLFSSSSFNNWLSSIDNRKQQLWKPMKLNRRIVQCQHWAACSHSPIAQL